MIKISKKIIALSLCSVLTALAGCSGGSAGKSQGGDDLAALAKASYPLKTTTKLKFWSYRGGSMLGKFSDPTQYSSTTDYEKRVGVKFDWTFATSGQERQQFNILMASGDLPDIISWYWQTDSPGSPDKAINDGYITKLNDLIPIYSPNFKKYLDENPNIVKSLKTDSGNYYYYPSYVISQDEISTRVSNGYIFRKDWLDELGLPIPETIDDWYKTLKAFKEKKGAEAPLCITVANLNRGLTGAFGSPIGWYVVDGKVHYGAAEPGFRDYLMTLSKWYNEGLIDKNIATIDDKSVDAKMVNGKAGASLGWLSNGIAKWTRAGREKNAKYTLTGVKFPVINRGDVNKFGAIDPVVYFGGVAISAKSKNKELAAKVMDYGFTDEGRKYFQVGTEGQTYTVNNGKYLFTDLILKNPDQLTKIQAISYYFRNGENIPMLRSFKGLDGTLDTTYEYPEQKDAVQIWSINDADKFAMPRVTPKNEENAEFAKISADIGAYVDEMHLKFIVGKEPIQNYEIFLKELNKRGLPRLKEIMQNAYDRYQKR